MEYLVKVNFLLFVGLCVSCMVYSLIHSSGNIKASKEAAAISVNETINIFSIASGHLYERFLRQVYNAF